MELESHIKKRKENTEQMYDRQNIFLHIFEVKVSIVTAAISLNTEQNALLMIECV